MPKYSLDELDNRLGQFLDPELPVRPTSDVNVALQVANLLESKGYSFRLKDMCPNSLSECLWRASFTNDEAEFAAENSQSAIAIGTAALAALESAEVI